MTDFRTNRKTKKRYPLSHGRSEGTFSTGTSHLSVPRKFSTQDVRLKSDGKDIDLVYLNKYLIGSIRKISRNNYLVVDINNNFHKKSNSRTNAIKILVAIKKKSTEILESDLLNLALMLPTSLPIKVGWLLLNKREFINGLIETLASNESSKKKINTIEQELTKQVEGEIASEFSKDSTMKILTLLKEQGCFEFVSKELNKNFQKTDVDILQNFFENTLEELIQESILVGSFGK
jgi:hypothetical protein